MLGQIPSNWTTTKVKYIVKQQPGSIKTGPFGSQLLSSEMLEGDIKVYNQNNVISQDLHGGTNYISDAKFAELRPFEVMPGDVLLTTRGTIGRCAIVPNSAQRGILHPCLMRLQPDPDVIFARYLVTVLQDSDLLRQQLATASNATTIDVVYSGTLATLMLPLPPLQEQKAIVAFLDRETARIDTLIERKQRLIALLEEKRQAVISHAVTRGLAPAAPLKDSGVTWLGCIPTHWSTKRLRYLCRTTKGLAFKADVFSADGVLVVKATDIKHESIVKGTTFIPHEVAGEFEKVRLFAGDVLMSTVGSKPEVVDSAVGQIAKVPSELDGALLNQNTVRLELVAHELCTNDFLFLALRAFPFRKYLDLYAHGTANQASLSLFDVLNYPFPLPPLDEQRGITEYVQDLTRTMDSIDSEVTIGIARLQEYRTALISAAVTGQIDVRDEVSP